MKHNDSLLLVVDMINGFIHTGALADPKINQITPNIIKRLKKHDAIFICDSHNEASIEFESFPKHCIENSYESEVIDELKPFVKKIVRKNSTNAFHCLDMKEINQYNEIIVTGCCSDICVLQLALTLKSYFNQNNIHKVVKVYEDSIATYDSEEHNAKIHHDFAISLMQASGVKIE